MEADENLGFHMGANSGAKRAEPSLQVFTRFRATLARFRAESIVGVKSSQNRPDSGFAREILKTVSGKLPRWERTKLHQTTLIQGFKVHIVSPKLHQKP